jgi:hypothetical protein
MGRERISGPKAGDQSRRSRRGKRKRGPTGLKVLERDGSWHVIGTVRAAGNSRRLRKSTDLPATDDTWDDANALKLRWERQLRDELVHGTKPSVPVAIAADRFLQRRRKRPLNARDVRIVQKISDEFGPRLVSDVTEQEWVALVEKWNARNKAETRERCITGVLAFLNWCRKKPRQYLQELPTFERDEEARKPKHRRARRIADLTPDLIMLMMEHAAPHLAGQMAAEWSTGGRVSSILFGCRVCDLLVTADDTVGYRGQLTFHNTKNGEPVVAALHPWAAERLLQYLEWRGDLHDREAPLFVTPRLDRRTGKKLPYDARGKGTWGNQNKSAFNGMKRRTIKTIRDRAASAARDLRRRGDIKGAWRFIREARERAGLVAQVTQHWFRHMMATTIMAASGNVRAAMEQAGWEDPNSVFAYTHDVPEVRRRLIDNLPIGAPLPAKREENKADG